MVTFGDNLKSIRTMNKMSQAQFAKLMNTTQQRISEWECNKVEPSLYNIIKILKIFNVTFEDLTDGIYQ